MYYIDDSGEKTTWKAASRCPDCGNMASNWQHGDFCTVPEYRISVRDITFCCEDCKTMWDIQEVEEH